MPVSRRDSGRRSALRNATHGGVLLRRGTSGRKVRNVESGRVLPCCYDDCQRDGDDSIQIQVPHTQPRWKDPVTGKQEMLVYIFCTEAHRRLFAAGTPYERRL